jgi:hypothetical protein
MIISITGAEIVKIDEKYSIFFENQLLISGLAKEVAVGIALNDESLALLQKNNKNNNVFYLKAA